MTSKDLTRVQIGKKIKTKNLLNAGFVHENIEINDHYLGESLQNKDSQRELTMQVISNDKTVRSNTVSDLK